MSGEVNKEIQLEIAHVLFIDIVGYSKRSINEQRAAVDELNEVVRASEQFQKAETAGRLLKIATGDGMALVFYTSPEAPAQCAGQTAERCGHNTPPRAAPMLNSARRHCTFPRRGRRVERNDRRRGIERFHFRARRSCWRCASDAS